MQCPQCDQLVVPGDRFCDNCGASFTAPVAAVAVADPTGVPVSCPCCGTVCPPGGRFCDQCGADLNPAVVPEQVPSGEGARTCRDCGSKENVPSDKFCGSCGAQLPVEQETAVPDLLNAPEKMRLMVMAWESCQSLVANDRLSDRFRMKMALLLEAIPDQGVSAVYSFLRELHQNDTELLPRVARLGAQYVVECYEEPEREFASAYLRKADAGDFGSLDVQIAFAGVSIVRRLGHLLAEENREHDSGNPITQLLQTIRDAWLGD